MYLLSDRFIDDYPVLANYLTKRKLKSVYMEMLDVMLYMAHMNQVIMTDRIMFYAGGSRLYEMLQRAGCEKKPRTVANNIKDLEHLGLVQAVSDKDIPAKQLTKLKKIQMDRGRMYRISCYHIPIDNPEVLRHACDVIEEDKVNNVRAHSRRTREGVARASGKKEADKIFVQQTNQEFSKEIHEFYKRYKKAIRNLFEKKGWCTEQEVINRMHYLNKKKRTIYSAFCLPDMIKHDLVQVLRFSKDVESKYGIDNKKAKLHYGSSKVIVPGVKWN